MAATGTVAPARAPRRAGATRPRLAPIGARAVEERTRRRRAHVLLVLAAGILVVTMLVIVAAQAYLSSEQVQLANLNDQLTAVTQSNANLQLERAQLDAPARILQIAESNLHMVVPAHVTYLAPVNPGPSVAAATR